MTKLELDHHIRFHGGAGIVSLAQFTRRLHAEYEAAIAELKRRIRELESELDTSKERTK